MPHKSFVLLLFLLLPFFETQAQNDAKTPAIQLLVIGDSLSAGYGVKKSEAYPALLEELLKQKGRNVKVINGAESGAISSAALPRLKFYYKRFKPDILLLAIGGNDARAQKPATKIKENLVKALDFAKEHDLKVILAGQKIFSNYGPEYGKEFEQVYKQLAKEYKLTFIPFLLEGVGGEARLNQDDGFHPNVEGHKKIARHVLPFVLEVL